MEPREIYERFRAVLFDMDGVLTTTARLHSAAWQRTFDEFLERWDETHGAVTPRFSPAEDYMRYVDGKPRYDGVRDFLASRNIVLPEGSADSLPDEESVGGIGNRKQQLVESALHTEGVEAFPGSVAWVRELQARGLATAVVSSSQNCAEVLDAAGIADLFDVRVDGAVAVELQLPGKPEPDTFLEAARRLGVEPIDAVVVEDALVGVQAGRAGGFGLVIGVDRDEQTDALLEHGADMVVKDLGDLVTESAEAGHMAGPKAHRLRAAALRLLAADEEFPVDEFRLVERGFNPDNVPQLEAVFAVANGYLGLRGTHEEGRPVHQSGTLLNGLYETWPIVYPEKAFGFAETGQTIVNATDGSVIKLYVDDEPFDLDHAEVLEYERVLDMRAGVMERRVIWQMADGRRFSVRSKRMVSLDQRHLACIEYVVTALDRPATLTISSELVTHTGADAGTSEDPRKGRGFEPGVLMPKSGRTSGARVVLGFQTRSSGQRMACGMDHETNLGEDLQPETEVNGDSARAVYRVKAQPGRPVRLIKYLAYHHAADESVDELSFRVGGTLDRARAEGLDAIFVNQRHRIDAFWASADVRTEGAPLLQQAMRFSLYQLLQASACSEGFGIPSKGLTGQGYEGHYFWDTEIYVMPFLVYTAPNLARSLLHHRYTMLDQARERARQVGLNGALFPWRTINGKEASAYYAAGTAQYHIDADVAYALMQYVRVTRGPRLPGPLRRRDPRRDGADVGGPWVLLVAEARAFRDQRRHGSRRVLDRRRQQRLHQPDGASEPAVGHRGGGVARGERAGCPRPPDRSHEAAQRRDRGLAPRRRPDVRPLRRRQGAPPAGRRVPGPRGLGLRRDPARELSAAAALPPTGDLPAPGDQAGRHRARHVPRGRRVHARGEAEDLRVLRPAHDGRLVVVGVHPEHRGRGDRRRPRGGGVLHRRRRRGPRGRGEQRARRRARGLGRGDLARGRLRVRRPCATAMRSSRSARCCPSASRPSPSRCAPAGASSTSSSATGPPPTDCARATCCGSAITASRST